MNTSRRAVAIEAARPPVFATHAGDQPNAGHRLIELWI
jgi:hypothetical protein